MRYRPSGKGQGNSGERKRRYEPQPIGEVLNELAARYGLGQSLALEQLQEAWNETVGPDIAPFTKAVGIKGGQLEVVVAASVWVQELNYQKDDLMAGLRERMPKSKIRGLRFKVGPIN
jgi:predicted nucleic acid-binding Zn ribbon protein